MNEDKLLTTLQSIYGPGATEQRSRYTEALDTFIATYGAGEVFLFRAPGRINLIGEHTDYNHGYVMPIAVDKDTLLLARPRADGMIHMSNPEEEFPPFSFTIGSAIPIGSKGAWENYAKGAAQLLAQQLDRDLIGFDGLIVGQLPYGVPRGSGLSSSTTLTVVVAIALAHFNKWQPENTTLARFCSKAEWYVGTRGGVLDQFSMLLTRQHQALFLDCRPDASGRYTMEHVPLPTGYHLMVADTGVHHRNVGGGFNQRVAACRAGVALLQTHFPNITHLRDVQDVPWTELSKQLPVEITIGELRTSNIDLGDLPGLTPDTILKVQARCRHVWTENQRVKDAVTTLRAGNVPTLGRLLNQAHTSARDDYEISCPELESLVKAAQEVEGVAGARLTGAGWGGCIVALVTTEARSTFEAHLKERYQKDTGQTPAIFACQAGPQAGLITVVHH